MRKNIFPTLCDCKSIEKRTVVNALTTSCSFILEKAANHKLIQSLSEASWAGKQSYLCPAFNQLFYHQGFIDKVTSFANDFFKILYAERNLFFSCIAHFFTLLSRSPFFVCPTLYIHKYT